MKAVFGGTYEGRRVLVTGHTGFKGSWLCTWLRQLGAEVSGYALEPPTKPSIFVVLGIDAKLRRHILADVRDREALRVAFAEIQPEIVFHLAAQSLVRESYREPLATVEVNILGTANLLEAVRQSHRPCAVVVVTSDKCYENREWVYGYREDDPLGGHDPYSMSKGAAELVVASWRRSFFSPDRLSEHGVRLASARAGNVIGGGDWQRDRIMADCLTAFEAGNKVTVRNPSAVRPWQHVLEPLGGYLLLGAGLLDAESTRAATLADAWNFGPGPQSCWEVRKLVEEVIRQWGSASWANAEDGTAPHEAGLLALCCDKAAHLLGWRPVWTVERAIKETVSWHKELHQGARMLDVTLAQIGAYVSDARQIGLGWAL